MRWLVGAAILLGSTSPAFADDPLGDVGSEDFFKDLESIPPSKSAEFGVRVGFGDVTAFKGFTPPWLAFGIHGGLGWHVGQTRTHRFGPALDVSVEGPFPEYFSVVLEPVAAWDHVDKDLLLGASLGLAALYNSHMTLFGADRSFGLGPSASVRIGYSQHWSRVMRRMYVAAEPKIRYASGNLAASLSVVVGSGKGW
jgi:hypothetical protein